MSQNDSSEQTKVKFPVVGIGASAGGLEALNAFFDAIPANTGMAFVVVQHLSHHQESILHELLQRHTSMIVHRIDDGMLLQPDHVYVLPAGFSVTLWNLRLGLAKLTITEGWPETINHFFESLARDQGEYAAAIILSGAGHDGTNGARAIKDNGGFVIAQDLETAGQSSMPFHVIDAGLADIVVAPTLMSSYLTNHFELDPPETDHFTDLTGAITEDDLKSLLNQLRRQTGYNFADYKVSTLHRQIARRMSLLQADSVSAYALHLDRHPEEANQLVKSLLIHVTSFFRDPEAFESLKSNALLPLLKTLSLDDVFRAWVPGCASGEEAISIAILVYECLREINMPDMQVRIFATDMNREVIQRARMGVYPASIAKDISAARLRDHFVKVETGYQIRMHISRMIVWAEHNLVEQPPFSNLYLISCRNVLIYFQSRLQERVRALFQFALRPNGLIFFGASEALPASSDIFSVIDSKHKIYQREAGSSQLWMRLDQPLFTKLSTQSEAAMTTHKSAQREDDDHELRLIKDMLLEYYKSTCAIVDDRYIVRYTYGDIDHYLRLVPGRETQHSILSMAREGLDVELTIALYQAFESHETVIRPGVWVKTFGDERMINVIIKPIQDSILGNQSKLVIFELIAAGNDREDANAQIPDGADSVTINRLHEELQQTRQALQSVTQALQAKSEELSSSMEEISSANEEIQTTNEELRTSKEELESMNEELNTLNSQLTQQNNELMHSNNTLYNFLQSAAVGVIFLDQQLAIREYTEAVTAFFSLRRSDLGRPLADIVSQLVYEQLIPDAMSVLNQLIIIEREVQTTRQQWYHIEIRPYRTVNNAVDGLVLTFTDITPQKQAQDTAESLSNYTRKIVNIIAHSLLELDGSLRVVAANAAFYQQFHVEPEDTVGRLLYDLGNGQWDIADLRHLLTEVIPQQTRVTDYVVTHNFPTIGKKSMTLQAQNIPEADRILLVITALSDDHPSDE